MRVEGRGTTSQAQIQELLAEAAGGRTLVVMTNESGKRLTLCSLALHALRHALQNGSRRMVEVGGAPKESTWLQTGAFDEHGLGWVQAGVLHERLALLASQGEEFSHVFCLDPWALCTVSRPNFWPRANLILLRSQVTGPEDEERDYWREFDKWLASAGPDLTVAPRAFLPVLPEATWASPDPGDLRSLLSATDIKKRTILVEEAEDRDPLPQVLAQVIESASANEQTILVSPHLEWYAATHAELLRRCAGAWRTSNLAIPVYSTLLRCVDVYVGPEAPPFGDGPLKLLRADVQRRIWRERFFCGIVHRTGNSNGAGQHHGAHGTNRLVPAGHARPQSWRNP